MKKNTAKLTVLTLCAAAIFAVPALSRAQDATNAPAAVKTAPAHKHADRAVPFRGSIAALDANAMTLTVGHRTFNITSETRITKDGRPAVLADGVAGEPVTGSYRKAADGTLNAATVHFRTKTAAKTKDAPAPAAGN